MGAHRVEAVVAGQRLRERLQGESPAGLAPDPAGAIAGFAAAGMGLAVLFPLALRAAAQRGDGAGPAVSAVSAMGYLGFLAGPPAVGGLAEAAGLGAGLAFVAVLCAFAALLAGAVRAPSPIRP
jgi:hypothetical protein